MSDLYLTEDARLLILEQLRGSNGYTAHEHALRQALAARGHRVSADWLRGQLAWLDEQGLINVLGDQVQVATLTLRGEDAAAGTARVPGVARPRP